MTDFRIENPSKTPSGSITSSGYTMNTNKILGRGSAGVGAIQEITLGTNLSLSGTTINAATGANYWTASGNDIYNNNSGNVGVGTSSPNVKLHAVATDTTIADPSGFSVSLVLQSLVSPPSDSPSFLYGPVTPGGGSGSENSGYTGYSNFDSVDAYVYSYRIINGLYYRSGATYLGNVTLGNSPSGIDWSWSAAVNGDGSGVDGYILNIIDNTMGTNYTYDIGNTTSYADQNPGGSFSSFSDFSGMTASGQSFNFEPYNLAATPSGGGTYASSSGGDFGLTETFNNGSLFWIVHNFSGSSGAIFLLDTTNSNSTTTADNPFYQMSTLGGGGSLPYPQSYGFLSDGSVLNQSFQAYSMATSPSQYFSASSSNSSTTDPNDGQYYYIQFTISSIGGGTQTRVLRQDGYHYDTASYPFAEDAYGPSFVIGNTVTPSGLTTTALTAQNSASLYSEFPALNITSLAGAPAASWIDYPTERLRIGYDPVASQNYIKGSVGLFFRDGSNNTLGNISSGSVKFNTPSNSAWSFLVNTANVSPFFSIFGSSNSSAFGGTANSSSWINLAAGSSTKGQLNFATTGSAPSSPNNGDMWFDGSQLRLQNGSFLAHLLQTGTASQLTTGSYPFPNSSGNLIDGHISDNGSTITTSLGWLFQQGFSLSSSKDITMGAGSRYIGGVRVSFASVSASTSLNQANHSPYIEFTGSTSGRTLTLPTAASVSGLIFAIRNVATVSVSIATTSSQNINLGTGTVTSLTLNQGDYAYFIATASSTWDAHVVYNVLPLANLASGNALTKTDDTNVTLTLGGSPSTALLAASSLTLGWTGTLSVARGGSGDAISFKDNVVLTNQAADISATAFTHGTTAGTYRVSYSLLDTTADITAGAVTLTFGYTDDAGSTTLPSAALVLTSLGRTQGTAYIQLASGNITYSTTHTGLFGTAKYALYMCLERLS